MSKLDYISFRYGRKRGFVEVQNRAGRRVILADTQFPLKGARVSDELGQAINGALLLHGYPSAFVPDVESYGWMNSTKR